MEGWEVGEYSKKKPGFCLWEVWGGEQGPLPGAGGTGWLCSGQRDTSSIILQYLPLHIYSLHQVDPGMVLGKLKHLPGPAHKHGPAGQDSPEASQHHHNLEHVSPDHSLHAALQDVMEIEGQIGG